jgi:hypothetical protein
MLNNTWKELSSLMRQGSANQKYKEMVSHPSQNVYHQVNKCWCGCGKKKESLFTAGRNVN